MLNQNVIVGFSRLTLLLAAAAAYLSLGAGSCDSGSAAQQGSTAASTPTSSFQPTSGASGAGATTPVSSASVNAIQVIPKADNTGSFDLVSVPAAGGVSAKASRLYNLDGSLITTSNLPTWFVEARAFITSTRTSSGATGAGNNTPCAYFDNVSNDVNPDTDGFYTIDGYNTDNNIADIDQCAGTASSELNQLGMYVKLDRRFINPTDKFQIIVKAKPIDAPNTSILPSSCVTSGYFDASACANQLFTVSMRTAPTAPTKPFYILFPTAKAFDLLSESILIPTNIDQSITTISIDRVKGGAVFYGFTVIRLP